MNYDDLIGRAFGANGQYLIEKKLGEGGMGVVVKAPVPPGTVMQVPDSETPGAVAWHTPRATMNSLPVASVSPGTAADVYVTVVAEKGAGVAVTRE